MSIAESIKAVREKIDKAARKSGRSIDDITLVAVTKTVPPERIKEAIECGVAVLGENRVQELLEKYDHLENVSWHQIGHLQTNKVKYIIDKVDLIHSVDSVKLAAEINEKAKQIGKIQDILIQLNISGEESKFGLAPENLENVIEEISCMNNIRVKGLMTIGAIGATEDELKKMYENCNKIFIDKQWKKYHNINMEIMSAGMSGDYETAIECGANMVRVGTAIFGARDYGAQV